MIAFSWLSMVRVEPEFPFALLASIYGLALGCVGTKVNTLPIDLDASDPAFLAVAPVAVFDSSDADFIVFAAAQVSGVFHHWDEPQVLDSVVVSIAIDVVNHHLWLIVVEHSPNNTMRCDDPAEHGASLVPIRPDAGERLFASETPIPASRGVLPRFAVANEKFRLPREPEQLPRFGLVAEQLTEQIGGR